MSGTVARDPPRQNLASLSDIASQATGILVIYIFDLVNAEAAYLAFGSPSIPSQTLHLLATYRTRKADCPGPNRPRIHLIDCQC